MLDRSASRSLAAAGIGGNRWASFRDASWPVCATAAVRAMSRPRRATRSWNRNPVGCERTLKAVLAREGAYK